MLDMTSLEHQIRVLAGFILDQPVIPEYVLVALDRLNQKVPMIGAMKEKADKYDAINTPELKSFWSGAQNEALHQRERWGVTGDDAGKTDADWFWLIGYLAGKALHNPPRDDMSPRDLRLHRIITVAAAAANWHGALTGDYGEMRPGIAEPSV